jgi:hypothetical protein
MMYVIYALLFIIAVQELLHRAERKDLYNRLMCRDINDYRRGTPPYPPENAHKRTLKKWRNLGAPDDGNPNEKGE